MAKKPKRITITVDVDDTWTKKNAEQLGNQLCNKVLNNWTGVDDVTYEVTER